MRYQGRIEGRIVISDILGRKVQVREIVGVERVELDVSELPKGPYWISVLSNRELAVNRLVIIY